MHRLHSRILETKPQAEKELAEWKYQRYMRDYARRDKNPWTTT